MLNLPWELARESSEPATDTGDAVAADDLLSTVEELAAGDGEIVDIGFDPMFPDEGYTITTRPASEEESAQQPLAEMPPLLP